MPLIHAPKPFSDKRLMSDSVIEGSVEKLVQVQELPAEFSHIWVNGKFISRDLWSKYNIHPTDHVLVKTVPMGGDSGKDVLRTIAFIAVAVLVPQFGFAAGITKSTTLGVKLALIAADTAIVIAATFAINALIPLPQPDDPEAAEDRFRITGAQNNLDRYGVVPFVFGTHKFFPPYGAMPYTETVGDTSYIRILFCLGYGPVSVSDIRIGQTAIDSFSGVQYNIRKGYTTDLPLTLFTNDLFEDAFSIKLNGTGTYQERTTQTNVDEITLDVSFPIGAVRYRSDGDTTTVTKSVSVDYRISGSADAWTSAGTIGFTVAERQPFVRSKRIVFPANGTYDVRLRDTDVDSTPKFAQDSFWTAMRSITHVPPVNKPGLAYIEMRIKATEQLNGIVDTLSAVVTSIVPAWNGTAWVSSASRNPAAHFLNVCTGSANSRKLEGPDLRTVSDASGYLTKNTDTVSANWNNTNGTESSEDVIGPGHALRCIFSAAGYLDVDLSTLMSYVPEDNELMVVRFEIQYWSAAPGATSTVYAGTASGTTSETLTTLTSDSEAWVDVVLKFNYGSTGTKRKVIGANSSDVGTIRIRNLRISTYEEYPIDLDKLETWYDLCAAESYSHDYPQTQSMSVYDTLTRICATGRASHSMYDGKHSVILDVPQTVPVQHFTPENSANFSGSKLFPEEFHAVKIRFLNEDVDYEEDELIIYDDSYSESNATKFTSLDVQGVTNSDHIWKIGRYYMATFRLRPEQFELDTDIENVVCTRGDLVRVTHDVPLIGLGYGRVTSATTSEMTIDAPVIMESGKTYAVRIRQVDGTSDYQPIDLDVGEQTTVTFTNAPIAAAPAADDLFMFGEAGQESSEFLVKGIIAGADMAATLIMEPYNAAVYTSDTGAIPAYTPVISIPAEMRSPPAPIHQLTTSSARPIGTEKSKSLQPVVTLIFRQPSGSTPVIKWESQYRVENTDYWKSMPDSLSSTIVAIGLEFGSTYDFRVRSVSSAGRMSDWTQVSAVAISFSPLIPDSTTQLVATSGGSRNITWIWDWPLDPDTGNRIDNIKSFELYVASSNSRAAATLVYEGLGTSFSKTYDSAQTNYAWIRAVSRFDNAIVSDWFPTSATGGVVGTSINPPTSAEVSAAIDAASSAQDTADGKITTYFQASPPVDALSNGDLWVDTDAGNALYRYSASLSSWVLIQDSQTALTAANDAQGTADGKIVSFFATTPPTPEAIGDIWFDTDDNNKSYRYDGSFWVSVQDGSIALVQITANDAVSQAAGAQATADGKVTTYYTPTAPTGTVPEPLADGDLWIDTDGGRLLYRYDLATTSWINVQDADIAQAISDAGDAQSTADGKIVSFYQDAPPVSGTVGDIWFDTNDSNRQFRNSGVAWVAVDDERIVALGLDIDSLSGTVDGKIVTFFQSGPPSAQALGDLWFDTNDGNKIYRWNGSAWVDGSDTELDTLFTAANLAQNTANAKVTTFFAVAASVPTALSVGDLWYQTDTNFVKRWNGTNWDANFATIGAPSGTDVGGVPADVIATPPINMVVDGNFSGYRGHWDYAAGAAFWYVADRFGSIGKYLALNPDEWAGPLTTEVAQKNINWFPATPTLPYLISSLARVYNLTAGTGSLQVVWFEADGSTVVSVSTADGFTTADNQSDFKLYRGSVTAPANAAFGAIRWAFNAIQISGAYSNVIGHQLAITSMYAAQTAATSVQQTPSQAGPTPNIQAAGLPDASEGAEYSTYVDTDTGKSYTKVEGAWVLTSSIGAPTGTLVGTRNAETVDAYANTGYQVTQPGSGTQVHPESVPIVAVTQYTPPANTIIIDPSFSKSKAESFGRYWSAN